MGNRKFADLASDQVYICIKHRENQTEHKYLFQFLDDV